MICARCDKPIKDGETYIVRFDPGASAAGSDIYLHEPPCSRPPEVERPRTYPYQRRI